MKSIKDLWSLPKSQTQLSDWTELTDWLCVYTMAMPLQADSLPAELPGKQYPVRKCIEVWSHQASLSMEFSGQEYWSKWPYPTPGIFPTQGPNPQLSHLLHWWQILYHCATWEAPTDIWRTFHMIAAEYTYFSSIRGTFPRIDNMVDHKWSQFI